MFAFRSNAARVAPLSVLIDCIRFLLGSGLLRFAPVRERQGAAARLRPIRPESTKRWLRLAKRPSADILGQALERHRRDQAALVAIFSSPSLLETARFRLLAYSGQNDSSPTPQCVSYCAWAFAWGLRWRHCPSS